MFFNFGLSSGIHHSLWTTVTSAGFSSEPIPVFLVGQPPLLGFSLYCGCGCLMPYMPLWGCIRPAILVDFPRSHSFPLFYVRNYHFGHFLGSFLAIYWSFKVAQVREGKPTSLVGLAPSPDLILIQRTNQQFSSMGVHFGANSSPWRAHVFSTRVSAWRLPFKADSRGNFTSHRFPLELNFIIAGFEEFTSTIIIDCVRNGTLGQGLRGSTPFISSCS